MSLTTLISKFEKLEKGIGGTTANAFNQVKRSWINFNLEQMFTGYNALGDYIGFYKNKLYALKKYEMNPLAGKGFVDLRLTGAFYKGTFVKIEGKRIITSSTDKKTPDLYKKYGKQIHGLTDENKKQFIKEDYIPAVKEQLKIWYGL